MQTIDGHRSGETDDTDGREDHERILARVDARGSVSEIQRICRYGVAISRLPLSFGWGVRATGNRTSDPLRIVSTIMPLRCLADWALSVKVLMPFFDHQLFVLGRNRLGLRDITQLHPLRFPQLDTVVQIEHRLSTSATDMDVNRVMVVAVEKENKSVFF